MSAHAGLDKFGFLKTVQLVPDRAPSLTEYPYSIPAIANLGKLALHPKVTYIIGENGSGKSTLVEAIAVAIGLNAEGGGKNFSFSTRSSESPLHGALQIARGIRREKTSYFLRAESFFNVATEIERLGVGSYGDAMLHEQSHGESFIALFKNRFHAYGLYILDEPEAALSVSRQFALLHLIDEHVQKLGSQFIIATHSPVLLAYPDAKIYQLDAGGIHAVKYEETESVQLPREFLNSRDVYLKELCPEYFRQKR